MLNNNIRIKDSIKTMRYLGNKTDLLTFIDSIIQNHKDKLNMTLIDAFGGTGCVTQYFNKKGFNVISNDINHYSFMLCYSRNNITIDDLKFDKLNMNIKQVLNF